VSRGEGGGVSSGWREGEIRRGCRSQSWCGCRRSSHGGDEATTEAVSNCPDQLLNLHRSAAIDIERGACRQGELPESYGDARDKLLNLDFEVAVAIAYAPLRRQSRDS